MWRWYFLTLLNFATLGIDANKLAHYAHLRQNLFTFFAEAKRIMNAINLKYK